MLAESALLQRTAAQWASPISLVRRGPGAGPGAPGRGRTALCSSPGGVWSPVCVVQWGDQTLGGVFCESHCVAHLPVPAAGFAPGGVWPVSWRGGCLSVWYVTVALLLRKRASRLGLSASPEPMGRHRGDKDLQAELGPRRVNVSPRQARVLTSRLQEGPLRPGRGVSGLAW